jgi:hypothetical protein
MKTYVCPVVTYICMCYYDRVGGHGQPAELLPTGKSFLGRKFAERGYCYERKTEAVL